jgi:translation initiation factor IF-3
MSHSRSLLSPAQALLRAFFPNRPLYVTGPWLHHKARRVKQMTTTHMLHAGTSRSPHPGINKTRIATPDPFPDITRDRAIEARYVRIPQPDGKLSAPEPLRSALLRVRTGTEHLVQISKVDDEGTAICRITTIAELLQQKRDKERVQKEQKKSMKQSIPKQIELNWAIGPNDLEHKLAQLQGFINEGKKVEVVLANKKRQRQATPEEGMEVLRKVREKLAEVDGKEIKQMQGGQVGQHTVLTMRKKGLE